MPQMPDFLHSVQSVGMKEAGAAGQGEGGVDPSEVMCDAGHSCSSSEGSTAAGTTLAVRWHRMQGMLKRAGDGGAHFPSPVWPEQRGIHLLA